MPSCEYWSAIASCSRTSLAAMAMRAGRIMPVMLTGVSCASVIGLPPVLTRTVDQLVAELDRRTPVVEGIRAQAQYPRDNTQC